MAARPGWDAYFLGICDAVAARADCTRRQVGAVVVDRTTKHIIAAGYNGAPPGQPGCLSDGACPRGRHYKRISPQGSGVRESGGWICGSCLTPWPCVLAVKPDSSYDTGPGKCLALHAELNACIRAGDRARGALLYCTDKPCDGCVKAMQAAGIVMATWHGGTWRPGGGEKRSWLRRLRG